MTNSETQGGAVPQPAGARAPGRLPLILTVLVLALFTRFYRLGDRPLHHDESIHAFQSYTLAKDGTWRYDPAYHGPFLYYANALIYKIVGLPQRDQRDGALPARGVRAHPHRLRLAPLAVDRQAGGGRLRRCSS